MMNEILRWLATRAGKIALSHPFGTTRPVPQETSPRKPYNKSFFDQACSVKMTVNWPSSFLVFMNVHSASVHKHTKKNLANIQSSWPRAWSVIHMATFPRFECFFNKVLQNSYVLQTFSFLPYRLELDLMLVIDWFFRLFQFFFHQDEFKNSSGRPPGGPDHRWNADHYKKKKRRNWIVVLKLLYWKLSVAAHIKCVFLFQFGPQLRQNYDNMLRKFAKLTRYRDQTSDAQVRFRFGINTNWCFTFEIKVWLQLCPPT